ncbi:MAG: imidazole glycerol phosphate synthase subunit HisH [Clostridiaceae bacterium]|nr:imidazole glycerol phosphate synthase subunit HisH [Clostridiaceae bacterium]
MIGIIDYGMGNLRSVEKALEKVGFDAFVSGDIEELSKAEAVVIPGVGAFYDAMENLKKKGLDCWIKGEIKRGKPFLGICIGMQILFSYGYEVEKTEGLGFFEGNIVKIPAGKKIPHMGWNQLKVKEESQLLKGIHEGEYVYFVHSYYADTKDTDAVKATMEYGIDMPAVVERNNIYGLQFHPEKSGDVGMKILKNFGEVIG